MTSEDESHLLTLRRRHNPQQPEARSKLPPLGLSDILQRAEVHTECIPGGHRIVCRNHQGRGVYSRPRNREKGRRWILQPEQVVRKGRTDLPRLAWCGFSHATNRVASLVRRDQTCLRLVEFVCPHLAVLEKVAGRTKRANPMERGDNSPNRKLHWTRIQTRAGELRRSVSPPLACLSASGV